MKIFKWLVTTRYGLTFAFVAGLALTSIYIFQPSWLIKPLESGAQEILFSLGVGIIPLSIWFVWVLWLLANSFLGIFKKWRYVIGFGILTSSSFSLMSYFQADLPIIGNHVLGGNVGINIRGSEGILGLLRTSLPLIAGIYFIFPRTSTKTLLSLAKRSSRLFNHSFKMGRNKFSNARNPLGRQMQEHFASNPKREYLMLEATEQEEEWIEDIDELYASSVPDSGPLASEATPPAKALGIDQELITTAKRKHKPSITKLPPLSLLSPSISAASVSGSHQSTAALIEETLAEHGVEVSVAEIRPGPSVTMFGLVPGWNRKPRNTRDQNPSQNLQEDIKAQARNRVKVDSIIAREKDLALALAAPSLRIEAPVPGESVVGVEVPNKDSTLVTIRTVMESKEYQEKIHSDSLPVALGLASAGEPITIDLLKMPHLLIAGATGSGKSVCINTIISSLITHQSPEKVRMLLVDPKRVELTPYNGIPHLVTPVVVDADRVVRLLRGAIHEMLRRYKLLEQAGVRNIQSYNSSERREENLPYFVICIDELADLMMTASFEVEQSICRLAQLGRATGIHLIVATQRPSVDVVTGLIKANFPSRISFAVASQVDSRTILDTAGAERLLGRGDMLFLSADSPKARRIQGVFISEKESELLSEHWREQPTNINVPEIPLEELAREAEVAQAESSSDPDFDENDSLYDRVMKLAANDKQLSTSLIQRKLRVGYPRAARLMDQLEQQGIVASTSEPGKAREVIYLPDRYR